MDNVQDLLMIDVQMAIIYVSNIVSVSVIGERCLIYPYLSYYLTFIQTLFIIKINTSLGSADWLNIFWCIMLYSFLISFLLGVLEYLISYDKDNIVDKIKNDKIFLGSIKIIYFAMFFCSTITMLLLLCDPDKC